MVRQESVAALGGDVDNACCNVPALRCFQGRHPSAATAHLPLRLAHRRPRHRMTPGQQQQQQRQQKRQQQQQLQLPQMSRALASPQRPPRRAWVPNQSGLQGNQESSSDLKTCVHMRQQAVTRYNGIVVCCHNTATDSETQAGNLTVHQSGCGYRVTGVTHARRPPLTPAAARAEALETLSHPSTPCHILEAELVHIIHTSHSTGF